MNKPQAGHCKAAGKGGFYHTREFRVADPEAYELGQEIQLAELVKIGDEIHISGRSKGRGFQGVVKRHGFKGQRASHGVKKVHRHQGGTSMNTSPARVFKGKRMPGRMGNKRLTAQNLQVMRIDADKNLLAVKGSVPGTKGGLVIISEASKG